MEMSQGALGYLLKRYRAVLKKCHFLNVFGSLALVGCLSLGVVGTAAADSLALNTTASYTNGASAWAEDINIGSSADLSVSGIGSYQHPSYPDETWRASSMIWAERSLNMAGGTVNLGDYGIMGVSGMLEDAADFADYAMKVTGGTINLNGSAVGQTATLRAAAGTAGTSSFASTFTLGGGENAAAVSVDSGKYGFIAAKNLNVLKNGSISVADTGHLTIAGSLLFADSTKAVIQGDAAAGLTITAGANGLVPNISTDDALIFAKDAKIEAGNLNFANAATTSSGLNKGTSASPGVYTFGANATDGPDVTLNTGGSIWNDTINIASGTYTISGLGTAVINSAKPEPWRKGSMLWAEKDLRITGGDLAVGDNGILGVSEGSGNALTISGGTVKLAGSAADKAGILRLVKDASSTNSAALTLGGGSGEAKILVDADKHGVIAVDDDKFTVGTQGTLAVADTGTLTILNELPTGADAVVTGKSTPGLHVGSDVTINGGAVETASLAIADGKTLTLSTGDLTVRSGYVLGGTGNGTLDLNGGTFTVLGEGLDVSSGAGLGGANLKTTYLKAGSATDLTLGTGNTLLYGNGTALTDAKSLTTGGGLTLGDAAYTGDQGGAYSGALNAGHDVSVATGEWSVGKLNQTAGLVTVGGTHAATLTVSGDQVGDLVNGAYASGSAGINVDNLGVFSVQAGALVTDAYAKVANVNTVNIEAGGTLRVNGLTSLSTTDVSTLKGNVLSGNGLLDLAGATITTTPGAKVQYSDVAGVTSDSLKQATVEATNAQATSGLSGGFKDMTVADSSPSTPATSATVTNTLQLAGSANDGALLANSQAQALDATVNDNAALTLGDANAANKGTLADVALTGSGTLNAVGNGQGAVFTTGDIDADSASNGQIMASGATLNATNIGATNGVGAVTVSNGGALISAGAAKVGTANLENGSLRAKDGLNVADLAEGTNSAIVSENGDVTLAVVSAPDVTGTIQAGGDITATGQTIASSGALTLQAGGDISVGNANDIISTGTLNITAGNTLTAQDVIGGASSTVAAKTADLAGDLILDKGSTLTLTGTGTAASTVAGELDLAGSMATVGDLTVASATTVTGGSLTGNNLDFAGGADVANGAQVRAESLTLGGALTVGDAANDTMGGTTLIVNGLNLAGNTLLIDPAWGLDSARVAVGGFVDGLGNPTNINGDVGVGMNSMFTVGTTDTGWLQTHVNAVTNGAGLSAGGVDAALGLYAAQKLDSSYGIVVDGVKTNTTFGAFTANTASFSGKSLLVVTADAAKAADGALSSTAAGATADIAGGAKLRITGARVGETYTVLGTNFDTINYADNTAWNASNLTSDSPMVALTRGTGGSFASSLNSASNVFPGLDGELVSVVDNMYVDHREDVNSGSAGVRFLSRATSFDYLGGDSGAAVSTMESAARIAVAGAAPQMAMLSSKAATNAITQRTSFASPENAAGQGASVAMTNAGLEAQSGLNAGDATQRGLGLWFMPLYQNQRARNFSAGNLDMGWDADLGGAALGADYTFDQGFRAGVTFNLGGGTVSSKGDLNSTDNDFNFWGVGAYAGWTRDNFGLTFDLGYTGTDNELKQKLPSAMGMKDLKADIDARALSAGLRAEYKFELGAVTLIPHAGVRYMNLHTDSYDVKSDGTLLHGSSVNQDIWTFPVGLAATSNLEIGNDWIFKPAVDLSVIPAAGDLKAKSKVNFPGLNGSADLSSTMVDDVAFAGGLGFDLKKDNVSFGLNYNIQASEHSTEHGVFGTFRYEF